MRIAEREEERAEGGATMTLATTQRKVPARNSGSIIRRPIIDIVRTIIDNISNIIDIIVTIIDIKMPKIDIIPCLLLDSYLNDKDEMK